MKLLSPSLSMGLLSAALVMTASTQAAAQESTSTTSAASSRICQQTHPGTNTVRGAALSGPSGKFGPAIESVLAGAQTQSSASMLDLETGRVLLQPPVEYFNSRVDLIRGWVRSNSLDISCAVWSTGAACVTYDMTVVGVESKCWEQTTAQELLGNPALAPRQHSPRRMLVLGKNHPDTYIFRTGDGTLGMLQLVGVTQQGVKIRYKLICSPTRWKSAPWPETS